LTYAVVAGPTSGALSGSAPDLTYTPNADFHGADSFTFTVNDGTTDSAAATVSITVGDANDAPVLAPVAGGTYAELSAIDFSASATDPDGDALSFSLVNAPAGAVIDPGTGAFSWTPTEAQGPGSYPFTVKVCDDGDPELCDEVEITITVTEVNVAPVLAAIGDKTANEMSSLAFTAAATDADLPANSLTFSLEGAPTGATINPATGAFSWTPTESQGPGTYPFSVKVCDNGDPALCDKEAITVTVNEAGLAPTANAQSITTAEDVPVSISLSGSDPDGDTLTFAIVTPPANGALSGSAPNLTYTPSADFNGADSFTFTVNDGTLDSEPATVSISVTPVNDAPVAKPKSVVTQLNASVPVELTGSDVDGDALTFQILTQPLHGTLSGTAPDLTYTPAGDYTGADSFTFAVSDGQVQSNPATVNIVVEAGQAPAFRLYLPLVSRQ
ncbi:MAG: tandem-95 repeat protein, partial [Anaerolineae bacterium]|nr:tandem-95 repeat protein [Anaerolineae bacterium]